MGDIFVGDVRARLRDLPAESVHCVVTSPPYWSLRSYSTNPQVWGGDDACNGCPNFDDGRHRWIDGADICEVCGVAYDDRHDWLEPVTAPGITGGTNQGGKFDNPNGVTYRPVPPTESSTCRHCGAWRGELGGEPTPGLYIEHIIEVMRDVWRVLRKDGTAWLNFGSSYASGGSGPNQSRGSSRAPAYGSDGITRSDSHQPDSACSDLCDGCRAVILNRHGRTPDTDQLSVQSAPLALPIGRDSGHPGSVVASLDASPRASQASTLDESSQQLPDACSHCANCGACLSVLRSTLRDAQQCARRTAGPSASHSTVAAMQGQRRNKRGKALTGDASVGRTAGRVSDSVSRPMPPIVQVYHTVTWKPKDLVDIPSLVAEALREDGWTLRQDIIWAKPSAMPESVQDRCTKSHEYLFLLAKSPRYYFDPIAIAEPVAGYERKGGTATYTADGFTTNGVGSRSLHQMSATGRNKRSVWTINTEPTSIQHFATYPEKLVEPCILAGTSERGVCRQCGAPWRRVTESTRQLAPDGKTCLRCNKDHGKVRPGSDHYAAHMAGGQFVCVSRETTGWQPTCKCVQYKCPVCATVIESTHEKRKTSTTETVSELPSGLPPVEGGERVLHADVLPEPREVASDALVRTVSDDVRPEDGHVKVLQPSMLEQGDVVPTEERKRLRSDSTGIYQPLPSVPSDSHEDGICARTSVRDGEAPWPTPPFDRSSASQEWSQRRQPAGKPRSTDPNAARQDEKAAIHGDVSAVQSRIPDGRQCPRCGAECLPEPCPTVPSTVLDIFLGSGTTARVAERLGRNWIGIELSESYAAIARKRTAQTAWDTTVFNVAGAAAGGAE